MYVIGWVAQSGQVQDFWRGAARGWSVVLSQAQVFEEAAAALVARDWPDGHVTILTLDEARQIEVLLCM